MNASRETPRLGKRRGRPCGPCHERQHTSSRQRPCPAKNSQVNTRHDGDHQWKGEESREELAQLYSERRRLEIRD